MANDPMSADAVRRCIADYEKERAALARLSEAVDDIRRRCTHTYDNGVSALGRVSSNGACEQHCNACDRRSWVAADRAPSHQEVSEVMRPMRRGR